MIKVAFKNLLLSSVQIAILFNIYLNDQLFKGKIIFHFFEGNKEYYLSPQHYPDSLFIDFRQTYQVIILPVEMMNSNLVKFFCSGQVLNTQYQRIIKLRNIRNKVKENLLIKRINYYYQIILILRNHFIPILESQTFQLVNKISNKITLSNAQTEKKLGICSPVDSICKFLSKGARKIVVAIDAGHGGKDPGAIGKNGYCEKNITMSIARKLENRLKADVMFQPVMTRNGDYFISVANRSEVARQKASDILVSIHADAASNNYAKGVSVLVLSNKRANSELGYWLDKHEKQSKLLGGAGNALTNRANNRNPYLTQVVLDLQFAHSQRVSYAIAIKVLRELGKITNIHKYEPEHASLGVLRAPDIPSILVETGFISNFYEERLLVSNHYQERLVRAIHKGLRNYFTQRPLELE